MSDGLRNSQNQGRQMSKRERKSILHRGSNSLWLYSERPYNQSVPVRLVDYSNSGDCIVRVVSPIRGYRKGERLEVHIKHLKPVDESECALLPSD